MLYAIVAVIILILDQVTKLWTISKIGLGATSPLIPGVVQLTNIQNTGAAFSFLEGGRWFFVVLTLVVTVGVIVLLSRDIIKGKLGRWMLVLVVAGGLGNCIDRAFKGYVVDMFQLQFKIFGKDFAIFNVSDIFITVCGIIFCVYLIFHKEPEKAPTPVRAPARTMPSERPVRADYITQLKKPVVEGRRSIEAELAVKAAEAALARNPEGAVTDWNVPDFADARVPDKKPSPESKQDYSEFFKSEPVFNEIKKEPSSPVKKNDSDFSIEDIIAEFKDK